MSGPSQSPSFTQDPLRVLDHRALILHNAHHQKGDGRTVQGCCFCERRMEKILVSPQEAPRPTNNQQPQVVQSSGTDEETAAALALGRWWLRSNEPRGDQE